MTRGTAVSLLVVALLAGLLVATLSWQRRAQRARSEAFAELRRAWADRGRAESWRTAPAWGGMLPEAADAATPWSGADSVLGMVLISALRDDGRGLSPDRWSALLDAVAEERPEDPLLPVAQAAVALRSGGLSTVEAGDAAPWQRWLELEAAHEGGQVDISGPASTLLVVWPRHRGACLRGVRSALAQGRLELARGLGGQCRWAGAPLLRLKGDLLDALGDSEGAWAAWSRGRADVHAAAISCQEGLGHDLRALEDAAPPAIVHRGWCALVGGRPVAVAEARGALGRLPDDQPPVRLARSALALAADEPGLALELLGDLDSARALVLRGRALAALGRPEAARGSFAAAQAQLPYERGVLRGWLAALPDDAGRIGAGWSGSEVLMLAQSDLVGDRMRPWFLVAGAQDPTECLLCEAIPGLAAALAGPPERCGGSAAASGPWCRGTAVEDDGPTDGRALRRAWEQSATHPDQSWTIMADLMQRHPTLLGLPRLAARWGLERAAAGASRLPVDGSHR